MFNLVSLLAECVGGGGGGVRGLLVAIRGQSEGACVCLALGPDAYGQS